MVVGGCSLMNHTLCTYNTQGRRVVNIKKQGQKRFHQLAEVEVAKSRDLGVNDERTTTITHLVRYARVYFVCALCVSVASVLCISVASCVGILLCHGMRVFGRVHRCQWISCQY
jgi:hypothetical protein